MLLLGTGFGFSQEFSFVDTPLSEAIQQVSARLELKVAFDAGQLNRILVNKEVFTANPVKIFELLLDGTGYGFEYKYGRYLVKKVDGIARQPQQKYFLHGIVYDENSGERLPYATVFSSNGDFPVSTTVNGTFVLTLPDTNLFRLRINYLGFSPLDTLISCEKMAESCYFPLNLKAQNIETIHVWGEKMEMVEFGGQAGFLSFNPKKFSDLPNFGETDVFRALQILPGISNSESSSQLNIRGGTSDQNLVLFDGFTLYNLDHFFGAFSALNPYVIKNIQVFKGGFESRYGERVSGIVDITGKTGNNLKPEISGGINLISGNISAEIPVSEKFTIIAAGRRAYSDMYSTFLADELINSKFGQRRAFPEPNANIIEPEFYFGDFNFKTTYTPNTDESISLSMYGSNDFLDNSNSSQRDSLILDTKDYNRWGNYGSGFSWKKQWNGSVFSDLQIGLSGYYNKYDNQTTVINQDGEILAEPVPGKINQGITSEENRLADYFVSLRGTWFVNPKNRADFGLSAKYNGFDYYKDAGAQFVFDDIGSSSMLYSVFFQDAYSGVKRLSVTPGIRASLYGNTGKLYVEPRLAASFQANKNLLFKMASGRYYQFLSKSSTEQTYGYNRDFWVLAGQNHPVVSSNHFIVGAGVNLGQFEFDLEAYFKTVDGLQEYLFDQYSQQEMVPQGNQQRASVKEVNPEPFSRFICGKGKAYGIDFLAKYENHSFNSLLAYSFSRANRNFTEINNNENIPALYNHAHELKWTNVWQAGKWHFSTLMVYTSGKPYIVSSAKDENFQVARAYSSLPDYYRLDFSANYELNIRRVNLKPGVSIINLFNTDNYYDAFTRRIFVNNSFIDETTLIKSPGLTFNFFVNFRF